MSMGQPPSVDGSAATGHPEHLAHHFSTPRQQLVSAHLGMWLFLTTEILMFSGLFCAYAFYRNLHPDIFRIGAQYLDTALGTVNTAILLASSFTMAWAVRAAQLGNRRASQWLLSLTLLGGLLFMSIKYVEYSHKLHLGLGPGSLFAPVTALMNDAAPGAAASEAAAGQESLPAGTPRLSRRELTVARPFFTVYFGLTALHGFHVLVGMGLILWLLRRTWKRHFSPTYYTPVDLVGLYWHLVDLIWIYLFPLLYLID